MPSSLFFFGFTLPIIHFFTDFRNYFSQFFLVCDPKPRSAGNAGSKSKGSSKPSSKSADFKPQVDCDILCSLGKNAESIGFII
jgi:hypothetical protein